MASSDEADSPPVKDMDEAALIDIRKSFAFNTENEHCEQPDD